MADTYETQGTKLYRGNAFDSPDSYVEVPLITSIDPVGESRSLIDVTHLQSESREYRLALKDGAEINVEAWYDPTDAQQAGLKSDLGSGTRRNFKIELTDSGVTEITFQALVTAWNIGSPIDNVYPLRFTLKPTSPVEIT